MKIAFIMTEKLPVPPISGGAVQIYLDGILPYLSRNHEITVYSVAHPSLAAEELTNNVRFVRLDGIPKEQFIHRVIHQLPKDFDLVHVFNRPKWVNLLAKVLPGTSIGLSIHNEMFRLKKISYGDGEKCIGRVQYINTVSRFIANGIVELYPEANEKVHVIYSGVNVDDYKTLGSEEGRENRRKIRERYGLGNKKVVLFVGRLCEKKGTDILLRAMESVMARIPESALMIIGSSWFGENKSNSYTEKLRKLGDRLSSAGAIIFTGFLTPDAVREHYNACDLFVCPSQWNEPLARVHYEAMAAGIPILTTDRGGNSEVVVEPYNGLLLQDYNNADRMAEKMVYLLKSPEVCRQMGINGRKLAESTFHFGRVAGELEELFQKIELP